MNMKEFQDYVDKGGMPAPKGKCGHELKVDDLDGNYAGYCADCYYEKLGDEIEKHPIGMIRKHGPRT